MFVNCKCPSFSTSIKLTKNKLNAKPKKQKNSNNNNKALTLKAKQRCLLTFDGHVCSNLVLSERRTRGLGIQHLSDLSLTAHTSSAGRSVASRFDGRGPSPFSSGMWKYSF